MKENKQNKKAFNQWVITGAIALVVAGAAFFGGMKYQQHKTPTFAGRFGQGSNAQGGRGNGGTLGRGNGFRPVAGEILSVDDKSVTVKMMDGSTKIVLLSDSTTYSKSDSGTKSDLKVGSQVAVFGMDNSDGSVTAQNISLNPMMRFGGMPTSSPQASPSSY